MCFEMIAKPTPTLLRTLAWDGTPRVHVKVDVGRCEDFHGIVPYLVRGIPELLLVAHAGSEYSHPVLVDESVYAALEKLIPLAPLHQPHNLAAIRAVRETQPQLPQVACFDTAFHRTHPHLAVDYFVHYIAKEIGALAAVLEGLDGLVFTAGVGENSPEIRARIIRACSWLGITLDADANQRGDGCISAAGSAVSAWVVPTNEELMIASHVHARVRGRAGHQPRLPPSTMALPGSVNTNLVVPEGGGVGI